MRLSLLSPLMALLLASCGGDTPTTPMPRNDLAGGGAGDMAMSGCPAALPLTLAGAINAGPVQLQTSGGGYNMNVLVQGATVLYAGTISYDASGTQATMTDNSNGSQGYGQQCVGKPVVYNFSYDASCSHVSFHTVSDQCPNRLATLDGSTLAR